MPKTFNKVEWDGDVLMDISDTTAEASDVADGEVFYDKNGTRQVGTLETAYIAIYNITSFSELSAALSDGKAVIIKGVPHSNDVIDMLVNWSNVTSSSIEIDGVTTAHNDLWDIDVTVTSAGVWSVAFVSQDSFMLLDFGQDINVQIPYCTETIGNTSIPNVDVMITDEMGADWAIASLAKYEVKDSSGNRINCWPVCMFSMNGQKTLRLRMMCAGTSRKTATRIAGAILLKHR